MYVEARIRTARYARSRSSRPCGRTPAYLHARYKPLSTGRLSNLDLSSSSIYTCALLSLTHARTHTHVRPIRRSLSASRRAFRRGPRGFAFSVSVGNTRARRRPTPRSRVSRGDSGICAGMDAAVGRSTETCLSRRVGCDTASCYTRCYESGRIFRNPFDASPLGLPSESVGLPLSDTFFFLNFIEFHKSSRKHTTARTTFHNI